MASENTKKLYREEVRKVEGKIRQISEELQQYKKAVEFEEQLYKLRVKVFEFSETPDDLGMNELEMEVAKEIAELENEVDEYLSIEGEKIKSKQSRENFGNQIEKIIEEVEIRLTEKSYKKLEEAIEEWGKREHNLLEEDYKNEKIAKALIKILKAQGKRGEEIDIKKAEEYCSREEIKGEIEIELIRMAEDKAEEERMKILKVAENLDVKTINTPELWKMITNRENIKIVGIEEEKITALEVAKPKRSFLDKLFNRNPKTTIYTFGEVDSKTGEWENIKSEFGTYPMKMSKEKAKKLRAIEVNDVESVKPLRDIFPNLVSIKLGTGIKTVEDNAFSAQFNLRNVDLNKELEYIGNRAFIGTALEEIKIPESVKTIGDEAFANCRNLEIAEIEEGVTNIGFRTFSSTALKEVSVPKSVETIGNCAFANCRNLEHVEIEEGVTNIGAKAFSGTALKEVNVPESVKSIGDEAFSECSNLELVEIGEGVTHIGETPFSKAEVKCSDNVRRVVLPKSLKFKANQCTVNRSDVEDVALLSNATFGDLKDGYGFEEWRVNYYTKKSIGSGYKPTIMFEEIPQNAESEKIVGRNGVLEVEYGYYPQRAVSIDMQGKLERSYSSKNLLKTGNMYTVNNKECSEYQLENERYVRVRMHHVVDLKFEETVGYDDWRQAREVYKSAELSNGKEYNDGDTVWVKVEPIKWEVDEKEKTMTTEKIICGDVENPDDFMKNVFSKEILQIERIHANTKNKEIVPNDNKELKEKINGGASKEDYEKAADEWEERKRAQSEKEITREEGHDR